MFGTTKNTVFSQLFSALIAYLLLIFSEQKKVTTNAYFSVILQANFLLPSIKWAICIKEIPAFN